MSKVIAVCYVIYLLGQSACHAQNRPALTDGNSTLDYETARAHELKPHRRTIPTAGAPGGLNQLRLTLHVSASGDVMDVRPGGDAKTLQLWSRVQGEVYQWRFTPFLKEGAPASVNVEEYVDLVPVERLPSIHVPSPRLTGASKVTISLARSGCYGTCPSYSVIAATSDGVEFDGQAFVVAQGRHRAAIAPETVRELGKRFLEADFFSLDKDYVASVTDNPYYTLKIDIDGKRKEVHDYVGQWVGMPAIVKELEDAVDQTTHSDRWINGAVGLVKALSAEHFDFATAQGQAVLRQSLLQNQIETVQQLLASKISLQLLLLPASQVGGIEEESGLLTAASGFPGEIALLIAAGASKTDQKDKDLALRHAAHAGQLQSVRALIAYGANPNCDLSLLEPKRVDDQEADDTDETVVKHGAGSILIDAASSGSPVVVKEILRYSPKLEDRDHQGATAIFAAGEYGNEDNEQGRVECVRLLVKAGSDVNARDSEGNTPLHEIFLTEVETELLRLGADVNARNDDGETPLFTNVNLEGMLLLLQSGADLTLRNHQGKTVIDVAKSKGPAFEAALQTAIKQFKAGDNSPTQP